MSHKDLPFANVLPSPGEVRVRILPGTEKVDNLDVDPLHDPEADDQDEKWVAEARPHAIAACDS